MGEDFKIIVDLLKSSIDANSKATDLQAAELKTLSTTITDFLSKQLVINEEVSRHEREITELKANDDQVEMLARDVKNLTESKEEKWYSRHPIIAAIIIGLVLFCGQIPIFLIICHFAPAIAKLMGSM